MRFGTSTNTPGFHRNLNTGVAWEASMQKDLLRKRKRRGVEPKNRDTDLMDDKANSHGDQDGLVVSNEEEGDNADSHGDQDDLTVFYEEEDNWVDVDDTDAGGEKFFPTNLQAADHQRTLKASTGLISPLICPRHSQSSWLYLVCRLLLEKKKFDTFDNLTFCLPMSRHIQ